MYGLVWYLLILGILRGVFRWGWVPAIFVAVPLSFLALGLGLMLWDQFGLD